MKGELRLEQEQAGRPARGAVCQEESPLTTTHSDINTIGDDKAFTYQEDERVLVCSLSRISSLRRQSDSAAKHSDLDP